MHNTEHPTMRSDRSGVRTGGRKGVALRAVAATVVLAAAVVALSLPAGADSAAPTSNAVQLTPGSPNPRGRP